jgi:ABC-type branched-subunit amino acid transport system substrate-binding protein
VSRLRAGACLSLTGRFAQFGQQAERGLRMWADESGVDLAVADDESEPAVLTARMPDVAAGTDLLFGPYSTVLTRAAVAYAQNNGRLMFNHGGSGGHLTVPGHVVHILTPADRYAAPFVAHLAASDSLRLFTYCETGRFGRDVTAGAGRDARAAGIVVEHLDWDSPPDGDWDLLSAGVYEDDVAAVSRARALWNPPRNVCSVAAGVASFAHDVGDPEGVYGVGQWTPGAGGHVDAGMGETEFLAAWRGRFGGTPDYPGVQAYAAGVIASEAARIAGTTERGALRQTLGGMDVTTVFGRFRIDPETGVQVGHEAVLTQWRGGMSLHC